MHAAAMHRALAFVTVLSLGLLACGSKGDEPSGAGARAERPASGGAAGAPIAEMPKGKVGPGRVAVPGLGISVEVPRAVGMRSGTTDQGKPRISIDLGDFSVSVVSGDAVSPTLDGTKAALKAAKNPLQKVTQETVLEGGWHLEYEAAGAVDKNKLHGVDVRATLGGTAYQCSAIARDHDDARMYAAVCDSMQKP